MNPVDWEIKNLKQLVGYKIVKPMFSEDKQSFGFVCESYGKILHVWVDGDMEGNGHGHLQIENPQE